MATPLQEIIQRAGTASTDHPRGYQWSDESPVMKSSRLRRMYIAGDKDQRTAIAFYAQMPIEYAPAYPNKSWDWKVVILAKHVLYRGDYVYSLFVEKDRRWIPVVQYVREHF